MSFMAIIKSPQEQETTFKKHLPASRPDNKPANKAEANPAARRKAESKKSQGKFV